MKISPDMHVYINGRFLTQRLTGVQRFAVELINAIDQALNEKDFGFRLELLVPQDCTNLPAYKNIHVKKIGHFKGQLWEQIDLPFYVKDNLLLNLCNLAPMFKKHQLTIIHDVAVYKVPEAYSSLFKLWYKLVFFVISKRRSTVATVSKFSLQEIHKTLGVALENLFLITEGKEHIERLEPDTNILVKHEIANRPYILAVSSMSPNKNFSIVVKAIELLKLPDVNFVIAGGANPSVFSSNNAPLPDNVKHVGYVTDSELKALYENATCFVFPSLYEGFGLPPMEAMTSGCPVLASNRASIPEVCGDAALYFDPLNAQDVAEKINSVIADPVARADMKSKGYEQVKRYSWKVAAAEVMDIIDRLSEKR